MHRAPRRWPELGAVVRGGLTAGGAGGVIAVLPCPARAIPARRGRDTLTGAGHTCSAPVRIITSSGREHPVAKAVVDAVLGPFEWDDSSDFLQGQSALPSGCFIELHIPFTL